MRALSALVLCTVALAATSLRAQSTTDSASAIAAPAATVATAPSATPAANATATYPIAPTSTNLTAPAASTSTAAAAVRHSTVPGLGGFSFEPTAAEKKRAEDQAKAEIEMEEEKPRNGIVRLPGFEVQGERPPIFRKQLDTEKGVAAKAVKQYMSSTQQALNFVHLPSWLGGMSDEQLALEMYHEQLRLDTHTDLLHQAAQLQAAGDLDSAKDLREQSTDLYIRPRDGAEPSYLRQDYDAIPSTNLNR